MTPEEIEYIQYRMVRARETLDEARLLLENDRLHGAINRLYYACLYVVSALLLTEGLSSSKHGGIRSLFDRHWVKTGRLPTRMGRFYHLLFKHRQQSDYGDRVKFERDDIEAWFNEAEAFVAEVAKQIDEQTREGREER